MTDPTDPTIAIDVLAAQPLPSPPPPSSLLEAELANLAPIPTRRPWRQLAVVVGSSLVYAASLVAVLTLRRDLHELPGSFVVGGALAWLLGFATLCYLALVPRAGAVMPRWRWAAASAIAAALVFVTLGLLIHPTGPSSAAYGWHDFARGHTCLEIGLASALVPVLLGALCLRGALPVSSRWIAAGLGAGGGSLGGLVLHLHCHVADGLHVGLIHGGGVIAAAVLSAALVARATDQPLR